MLIPQYPTQYPNEYNIYQNYPNPFNPVTTIKYDVALSGEAKVVIYDLVGNEVNILAEGFHSAGEYQVVWNAIDSYGNEVPSGMYIYQLQTSNDIFSKKMVLLR